MRLRACSEATITIRMTWHTKLLALRAEPEGITLGLHYGFRSGLGSVGRGYKLGSGSIGFPGGASSACDVREA